MEKFSFNKKKANGRTSKKIRYLKCFIRKLYSTSFHTRKSALLCSLTIAQYCIKDFLRGNNNWFDLVRVYHRQTPSEDKTQIGIMVRVFANDPGDRGPIPDRIIPKTRKMVLDAHLLNTRYRKVRIKGKWNNPRKGVVPSLTPWCSSYCKGSLQFSLDYGQLTY